MPMIACCLPQARWADADILSRLILIAFLMIGMAAEATDHTAGDTQKRADTVTVQSASGTRPFETVGLYVVPPQGDTLKYYDFYKVCGFNYLEFCDRGYSKNTNLLVGYYDQVAKAVNTAHEKGFKVWILLLAGMKQWPGPTRQGFPGTFSALNQSLLQQRLSYIRQAVQRLQNADGFEFFAGDPGGDPSGRSTYRDCIRFATQVKEIVNQNAPKARFAVNLWAVAEWDGYPSPFGLGFWQKQVTVSKAVAEEPGFLGGDCGVLFPLDNYYRSLALACYAQADLQPELYPLAADMQKLRARGVNSIYGWPYFLVDEVDDGFITPNNVATHGQSQSETRYLRRVIDQGRELGLDGMVGNAQFIPAEALNIYAFGRMCHQADLTPRMVLEEYSSFIANAKTSHSLAQILSFIENNSNWQNSLPPLYRLKNLDCGEVTSASIAMAQLDKIVARKKPPIPLPESPQLYLQRLRKRLEMIASGHIGGVSPIITAKPLNAN
jgi:hypothetical protein